MEEGDVELGLKAAGSDEKNVVFNRKQQELGLEAADDETNAQEQQELGLEAADDETNAQEQQEQSDYMAQQESSDIKDGGDSLGKTTSYNSRFSSFHKEEQKYSPRETLILAYQTLGVVYGDLGTSPLYVFPTIQIDSGDERDYLGILSIIFWTLTLVALLKYVLIVLRADDHGEGGTFALYSLLCRHANIGKHAGKQYGRLESDVKLSFFDNPEVHSKKAKQFLERNQTAQKILLVTVMVGTCMVIGDGVLTPAISVLSATGGIKSAVPAISQTVVIVISCVILVGIFLLQSFGTSKVSFIFSPVMLLWFLSTTCIGIYNISVNYPGVLKALSPYYVVEFFLRNKIKGWKMLGAIVLCITGAEAMFADLGHFNKRSIQVAFTGIVYPALILTYAGETAYLIKHPQDRSDAFFKSVPHVLYWPMFVIATLAAIVASQALISATFSVLKQSMSLGCFPRIKLVYTSAKQEGQVYSPEVNYILMILCLAVLLGFRNGADIGSAFGVAVIWVMIITTFLVAVVMLVVWQTPLLWIVLFVSVFGSIEAIYMTAVLRKVPQGGWVPFAIAAVFLTVSLSWNYGRRKKYEFEARNNFSSHELADMLASTEIKRVAGMCLFYSNLVHGLPPVMLHYVKAVGSLHEVIIFLTIRVIPVKTVLASERFFVARGGVVKGLYRCVARYGYLDDINMEGEEFLDQLVQALMGYIRLHYAEALPADAQDSASDCITHLELVQLEIARRRGAVHVIGHSILRTRSRNCLKRIVVDKIYRLLHCTCRSAVATFRIPSSQLLQVAMVYET